MPVQAMYDYQGTPKDVQENFHGKQLVYLGWDKHLMFCSPVALPLPPEMPFEALVKEVLPSAYGKHPDFEKIDWDAVAWTVNQQPFTPDMDKGLAEQGIEHKSVIRMRTPGLEGIKGSAT
ncbi:phenol hydroxylase subunit P4 [Alkalilimnicola sp. S0819]|uniref:phenol hydroxylase subunit P4 n=1 Tax=Alkalilimnicola sp. S0819 TaxID=2613922 RepID=UPI0012615A3C|nr:phenol hydroxylase subunit P4 [Alkalilimnicola sp. S0819]KAB7627385.1 phenol hydroxylase [Alkalilimnicola sp. S0819]MPQ16104.1 phenol hydroxylase [Alkalilimnicola sp. S0819]